MWQSEFLKLVCVSQHWKQAIVKTEVLCLLQC